VTITASITLDNPSGGAAPFGFTATAYGTTASGEASADTAYQNLDFVWVISTNAVAQHAVHLRNATSESPDAWLSISPDRFWARVLAHH
jgi:hypothetical protein